LKGLADINFETEAKIRKALVSVSLVTLVLSNVELASNELNFFGLTILISLPNTTAVLRLVIVLLVFALLLILAERLPRLVAGTLRNRDNKWWEALLPEINAFQGGPSDRELEEDYYTNSAPDWDDLMLAEKNFRAERRVLILGWFRPIALVSRTVTRYIFPLSLALVALLFPQSILLLA